MGRDSRRPNAAGHAPFVGRPGGRIQRRANEGLVPTEERLQRRLRAGRGRGVRAGRELLGEGQGARRRPALSEEGPRGAEVGVEGGRAVPALA